MRVTHKNFAKLDQILNPKVGPRPILKKKDITLVDLMDSDEEKNKKANKKGWIGQETDESDSDDSIKQVNPLHYIRLPGTFGNLPGDKERHDEEGNFKVIKIEAQNQSDDYSDRLNTSKEEDDPMENPLNYDLVENSESRDHVTNNVPNEEQDISPQPGTSSGKPTQVGNWNDAISMQTGLEIKAKMENTTTQRTDQNELTTQAEMEFDSSEGEDMPKPGGRVKGGGTTKAKRRVQGRFVFNTVAFPEFLHELLDDKLTVTTRLGNTA